MRSSHSINRLSAFIFLLSLSGGALSAAPAEGIVLTSPDSGTLETGTVSVAFVVTESAAPQSEEVIFNCTGGTCAQSAAAPTYVLTKKVTATGADGFSFNPNNLAINPIQLDAGPDFITPSIAMAEGIYAVQAQYLLADGGLFQSNQNTGIHILNRTQAPQLLSPASNQAYGTPIQVSYWLPEVPSATTLTFASSALDGGPAISCALRGIPGGDAGTATFALPPANPLLGGQILSCTAQTIPDGVYTVTLSYQDLYQHPAASASSTNVTLETVTQAPTLLSPITNGHYAFPLTLSWTLPETPLADSCSLLFIGAAAHSIPIPCISAGPDSFTLTDDQAALFSGTFSFVSISYQNQLGDHVATAAASNVVITQPVLSVSSSHVGNFRQGELNDQYTLVVSNSGSATYAPVTLVDTLPAGMTAISIYGDGWACTLATLICTRSDALAKGSSYPPVTVNLRVSSSAAASLSNNATVSSNGIEASSDDATTISCIAGTHMTAGGCIPCGASTYESNGACVACSDAGTTVHEYMSAACTATADAVYSPCDSNCDTCAGSATHCTGCGSGSTLDGGSCVRCTVCAPGSHQNAACTSGADTTCELCAPGSAAPQAGQLACDLCDAGTFTSIQGAITCETCPPGTFSDAGQNVCPRCAADRVAPAGDTMGCLPCEPGTYPSADNTVCIPCAPGTATMGGEAACTICPPGKFASGNGNEICFDCLLNTYAPNIGATSCMACPPGMQAPQFGAAQCQSCPDNQFLSDAGCVDCSGACGANQYLASACSDAADRVCGNCDTSCATCRGTPTQCTSCNPGSYLQGTDCIACSACAPGSYQQAACTASTDTVCAQCSAGSYASTDHASTCTPCAAGSYAADAGATACAPCLAGTYSGVGQNSCSACAAGEVAPSALSANCLACAAGSYPDNTNTACINCPTGTYSQAGDSACTACAAGTAAVSLGSPSCTACAAGAFAAGVGSTSCGACPAGTAAAGIGSTSCVACAQGTYAQAGSTGCTDCGSCDDANDCTTDLCSPTLGCTHTAIAGCHAVKSGGGCSSTPTGAVDLAALALLAALLQSRRRRA